MYRLHVLTLCIFPVLVQGQLLTSYVDPFVGTANGGNTFPGAVQPWGMVSVSPHNAPGAPSGYMFGSKKFFGLGHVHLSGTGCAELGSIVLGVVKANAVKSRVGFECTLSDEEAEPGYYAGTLVEPEVRVEASVTPRCGLTQLACRSDSDMIVVLDAGRSLALNGGGSVTVLSPSSAEGFNIAGGFCGESNRERVYFAAEFNEPAVATGVWRNEEMSGGTTVSASDTSVGCWFRFAGRAGRPVLVKVGISYVSVENARRNLRAEIPGWDFKKVRREAGEAWERALTRIRVEGGSRDDLIKFYSALYHLLIHPNIISDVNGEYPLMGHSGIGRYIGRERYTVFSLWDTYRTLHPFLTLVYPERQSEMAQTMLDMAKESGWLPKWELAANETYMMVGDPGAIVLADTYLKGVKGIDGGRVLEAMTAPSRLTTDRSAPPVRAGYHEYLRYGYIPFEQDTTTEWWVWGPASTTLEYCLADWSTARLAERLGQTEEAVDYDRRSLFYRNLFDPGTKFIRPRKKDGSWLVPFHPAETEGSGSWSGSGGPGYVEGNAWQYTWFVPHDIEGLVRLFGGSEEFVGRLQECFETRQFTINNEPDIAYPYLFTYIPGEEHHTATLVHEIMKRDFNTGPGGLPGNDDAGTISAWFVFSALGIYPACPASGEYRLGSPLFSRAVISLNGDYYRGTEFVIRLKGNPGTGKEIRSIMFNGRRLKTWQVDHGDVVGGGELVFDRGD